MQTADFIAAASLAVAFAALGVAFYAVYKSNRNSSVATLVTLNEAFRQAWERFLSAISADDKEQSFRQLGELMNLLEIACGIQVEGSLSGMSKRLNKEYLDQVVSIIVKNDVARTEVTEMMGEPTTFCNIKRFINSKPKLSVTIPPDWYQIT